MNYSDIVDVKSAKERFMGNYAMFSKFLFQFPEKSLFGNLKEAVAAGDAKKAFEVAHTMKGIAGNLSLKLIEKPLHDTVERLRKGDLPEEELWNSLVSAYEQTVNALNELKAEGTALF